jgi:hypothetical protein
VYFELKPTPVNRPEKGIHHCQTITSNDGLKAAIASDGERGMEIKIALIFLTIADGL